MILDIQSWLLESSLVAGFKQRRRNIEWLTVVERLFMLGGILKMLSLYV